MNSDDSLHTEWEIFALMVLNLAQNWHAMEYRVFLARSIPLSTEYLTLEYAERLLKKQKLLFFYLTIEFFFSKKEMLEFKQTQRKLILLKN